MNLCSACGEDFGSDHAFRAHRVGKHSYTFSADDPSRLDGRRCLSVVELKELGWNRDKRGRWRTPPRAVSEDGGMRPEREREVA
jgi:hypothetical protein